MSRIGSVAGPSRLGPRQLYTPRRCIQSTRRNQSSESGSNSSARLRFAPSPTGQLHLGGLRTALFNHLLARKWGGKWILRIEDTDRTRLVEGSVDSLRQTLEWAGLDYDEGIGAGGDYGPYMQSERLDLYHHHIQHLISRDKAYECFCSADELQSIRAGLHQQGHRHTYDGRCRHLTEEERGRRKKAGKKHVVRFKADLGGDVIPFDLIHGNVQFPALSHPDDVVLLKSDGFPTYHLASVVDDHEMKISHVLRGEEEWLPSVPKHHALYRAFGWTPPEFAHLPLLVNMDGTKLSKRTGDVSADAYRKKGYEPEALLNFLALMGWDHHSAISHASQSSLPVSDPTDPTDSSADPSTEPLPDLTRSDSHSYYDLFTIPQLIQSFSLDHVNTKKAAVNMSKLDFINKLTLRRKAGQLGSDGVMLEIGKVGSGEYGVEQEQEKERGLLVDRVQEMLRAEKVLEGNPLVKDRSYVERVFEAELPRTVLIKDMATSSIFFFLPVQYDTKEASEMIKTLEPNTYINLIEDLISELEYRLGHKTPLGLATSKRIEMTQDIAWRAIHAVVAKREIKKSELLTPMRHALTGRRKGPGVPSVMSVIGAERSLHRLEQGVEYVRNRMREGLKERNKK